ncbi:MAG: hypothetical protein IJN80_04865 [Clostridia bacterium]|nr:hypothetical protein [Clostridia bacterium]
MKEEEKYCHIAIFFLFIGAFCYLKIEPLGVRQMGWNPLHSGKSRKSALSIPFSFSPLKHILVGAPIFRLRVPVTVGYGSISKVSNIFPIPQRGCKKIKAIFLQPLFGFFFQ